MGTKNKETVRFTHYRRVCKFSCFSLWAHGNWIETSYTHYMSSFRKRRRHPLQYSHGIPEYYNDCKLYQYIITVIYNESVLHFITLLGTV